MSVGRPAASPTKKDWLRPGGQAGSRSSTRRVPRTVGACGCARPRTRAAAVPAHLRSGSTPALQCSTKKSHMPRPGLRKSSSWVAMKTWCSVARGGVGLVARDDLVQRRRGARTPAHTATRRRRLLPQPHQVFHAAPLLLGVRLLPRHRGRWAHTRRRARGCALQLGAAHCGGAHAAPGALRWVHSGARKWGNKGHAGGEARTRREAHGAHGAHQNSRARARLKPPPPPRRLCSAPTARW